MRRERLLPDAGCREGMAGRCPGRGAETRCEGLSSHQFYARCPGRSATAAHDEGPGHPANPQAPHLGPWFCPTRDPVLRGFPDTAYCRREVYSTSGAPARSLVLTLCLPA